MRVSIKSIAEDLKLSKATVSWILSGKGKEKGFSETTIELVSNYAKKIGYSPNMIARSLSKGHSNIIGLIIPAINDIFYSQMTQAIEKEVSKNNYLLIVCSSEGNPEKEYSIIKALQAHQIAGMIIAPTYNSNRIIAKLIIEEFPFVLIDRYLPEIPSNYIITNNESSSYQLVNHLFSKGSQKIAIVTTDTYLYVMNKRMNGYKKSIIENTGSIDERLYIIVNRDNYEQEVNVKLDQLFETVQDVDGFFFTTHYLAETALKYFITHHIDCNSRFNMGCIHTTEAINMLAPNMSKAMMPISMMGTKAVDILLNSQIKKANLPMENIIMKNELVLK